MACRLPRFRAMTPRGFDPRPAPAAAETAERRFRDLVHEVDGIVWELELTTQRFTFVNRRAEELTGVREANLANRAGPITGTGASASVAA